ncbi:hypothetical protein ID866_6237 [Astraeus odoratus]|nr:hypothetical protein ID866_6237 [Astraeus odoratus]
MAPLADLGCSILGLAAEKDQVLRLLRGMTFPLALCFLLIKDTLIDDDAASVAWTITNKYYTADVQFIARELSQWTPLEDELKRIPAVLFVWSSGQPYREHAQKLSQQLSCYEFEVVLAIRLAPSDTSAPSDPEDVQDIDAFLAPLGYEFVDAVNSDVSVTFDRIPGIPRIVDALSTIMWPSMTRKTVQRGNGSQDILGVMHLGRSALSDSNRDLASLLDGRSPLSHVDYMQRQFQELERWLDEDSPTDTGVDSADDNAMDPWSTAVTPGNVTPDALSDVNLGSHPATPTPGFDDDFTSFISASLGGAIAETAASPDSSQGQSLWHDRTPPLASMSFSSTFSFDTTVSSCSTPNLEEPPDHDTAFLMPGNTSSDGGVTYNPLGSVSDFGDVDTDTTSQDRASETEHGDSEDEDEEMPTEAEILETSRRIFSAKPLTASPIVGQLPFGGAQPDQADLQPHEDDLRGLMTRSSDDDGGADAKDELGRFDLQGVLSALQGYKEEIASMSDDKARRKAAARVALGLVYGLDPNHGG